MCVCVCVSFGIAVNFRFPKGPSNISLALTEQNKTTGAIHIHTQWRHHPTRCNTHSPDSRVLISLSFALSFLCRAVLSLSLSTQHETTLCCCATSFLFVCVSCVCLCVSLSRSLDYYYSSTTARHPLDRSNHNPNRCFSAATQSSPLCLTVCVWVPLGHTAINKFNPLV